MPRQTATETMKTPRKPPRKAKSKDQEVQDYLDRYARAHTSGDGETVASMWEVPALVVGEEQALTITELQQVKDFFGGAKPMYNERGIFGTRAELLDVDRISDNLVNCLVRWPHLDANEEEIGEESSNYTLRRGGDGQLKMRVVVMRGEKVKH
jgi:hypothetical protein